MLLRGSIMQSITTMARPGRINGTLLMHRLDITSGDQSTEIL
jgi:hypothetical protein